MRTILALLAALSIPMAYAAHSGCSNTVDDAVPVPTTDGTYYLWNDVCQDDADPCLFSVWIGKETNDITGWQVDCTEDRIFPVDCSAPCAVDEIVL